LFSVKLMGEERDTFGQLEQANRRKTVELVAVFVLIYAVCGSGLDLIFHTFRVVNHQLTGFPWLTIAAVLIASTQAVWAWYRGSSIVISAVQGDDLTPASVKEQAVVDVVSEMALAARMPMPRVCVMGDPAPNAFAAGRDPEHSVICVTRGLIDQLDREELQGVIAHEMAHIRGHDTRVTQMAVVMVGGFALLSGSVLRMAAAIREAAIPFVGILLIPIFILGAVGWCFSKAVAIALSRQREYLADAAAVEFTRNPTALIRALEHIARIESPLKAALRGVASLFIVDPFECGGSGWTEYLDEVARIESQQGMTKEQRDAQVAGFVVKGMPQISFQSPFSSHPPLHDRIARLRALLHEPSGVPGASPAGEASGTSGMKVLANGGVNLSELDGWWAEAYEPEAGWALGDGREHGEDPGWDAAEALQMHGILEHEVIARFYDRDGDGLPRKWITMMRESMARLTPQFSANRAVREYTEKYYLPVAAMYRQREASRGALGVQMCF